MINLNIVPNTIFDIPAALRANLVIDFSTYSLSVTETRERGPERRVESHSPTQNTITFGIRIFISLLAIGSAVDMENEFQLLSGGRLVCTAVWAGLLYLTNTASRPPASTPRHREKEG